jgi:uncharacterized protein YneF (UPF0154 family)
MANETVSEELINLLFGALALVFGLVIDYFLSHDGMRYKYLDDHNKEVNANDIKNKLVQSLTKKRSPIMSGKL